MRKVLLFLTLFFCFIYNISALELPRLYFEGDLSNLKTKKESTIIKIKYAEKEKNIEGYAQIKLQGSSSLLFEKKNYTIKLYSDENLENKLNVDFGWGKQNKYCLKANWIDKTHARNIVSANIVADIQKKYNLFENTPNYGVIDGYPIEIYLNNDFLGLYTLNIPKDAWMFNMDEENENHIVLSSGTWEDSNLFKAPATFNEWEVEAGLENEETLNKLNRLIKFVYSSTDEEFKTQINDYFNFESLINYYVMVDYAQLFDNVAKNMLLVTYDGKIWYTSLYDLDTSWGTHYKGLSTLNYEENVNLTQSELWSKVKRNFPNEIADRYYELRKDILNKENVLKEFNNFINSIPEKTFAKEKNRWKDIPGYDINQIEEFLDKRIPIIEKSFADLYTIEPKVTIKYFENKNGSVTAKFIPNRKDLVIMKNNKVINNTYIFTQTGEQEFEYMDSLGNKYSIEASATVNDKFNYKHLLLIGIILVIVIISIKFINNKKINQS